MTWRCWGQEPSDGALDPVARRPSQGPQAADLLARVRHSGAPLCSGGARLSTVVGEIAQVRTQATGKEGERPDLAGFDRDGRERVLIEAKFWAGLTGNQPVAYLERLPANTPSALLFVAPAARLETLWNELLRTVAKSQSGITLASGSEAAEPRSAAVGGRRGASAINCCYPALISF